MMDALNKKNSARCPGQEQLSAYADRELELTAARAVAAHISICDPCARCVTAIEDLSRAFRELPPMGIGSDIAPRIELAVARAARQRRLTHAWRFAPLSLAAAATVMLGVFIGTMLATAPTVSQDDLPMAMFDAIPPGGVCIGFDSCYTRGKI